ncbi:MAG: competence protein CoiA family protein [Phycisphaeraceae bacterium]
MPLKAIENNEVLIAPLLSQERWERLRTDVRAKRVTLRMACCDTEALVRESKLGTRHFYHKPGAECGAKGETLEHLLIKEQVALGACDAGCEVDTEVQGRGWRADVLATRDTTRVAFEVQWSAQTLEETSFRQDRYAEDYVQCAWLFRRMPKGAKTILELPMFQLGLSDPQQPQAAGMSIRQFAAAMLSGLFKFCESASALDRQAMKVQFFDYKCWKCHHECHAYRVTNDQCGLITQHGDAIAYIEEAFQEGAEYSPDALQAVHNYLRSEAGRQLRLGAIKTRFSKTAGRSYMSQGCPNCDALFGEFYLRHEPEGFAAEPIVDLNISVTLPHPVVRDQPHWCYSPTKEFCC